MTQIFIGGLGPPFSLLLSGTHKCTVQLISKIIATVTSARLGQAFLTGCILNDNCFVFQVASNSEH
eukprot:COSAG06_NODE_1312_length_9891_cov_69.100082_13_plen_66_part_00